MKQRIPLLTALVAVASTGIALGCGCSSTRLAPVRELIVQQPSTCLMETRSTVDWGAPFRAVGSVISAPFVAIGSAFSPSERYVEPVGERLVYTRPLYYRSTTLMPVGERFTTVKIIRSRTLLEPVGERFIITKKHCYSKSLKPVGERFLITKHHTKMLKPVGEKLITHKVMLKPGQNLRVYSQKW